MDMGLIQGLGNLGAKIGSKSGDRICDPACGSGNLFPTTSIPVAILVFDRSREKGGANQRRMDVLFVDASREYLPNKNQNALSGAHIEKILTAVKARKDADKYAHVATFDEIKGNDFNLNIPRYLDTFEEEKEIDIDAVQQEIDALEKELVQVWGQDGDQAQGN